MEFLSELKNLRDFHYVLNEPLTLRYKRETTYLNVSVKKKEQGIIQILLDSGARIMVTDENNGTPLHLATLTSLWQNCYFAIGKVFTKRTMTTKRPWKKRKLIKRMEFISTFGWNKKKWGHFRNNKKCMSETKRIWAARRQSSLLSDYLRSQTLLRDTYHIFHYSSDRRVSRTSSNDTDKRRKRKSGNLHFLHTGATGLRLFK